MKKRSPNLNARVRSDLILKEITLKDLAARAGVTTRMLAYVLRGKRRSPRVQRVVAEVLGVDFEKLWGKAPSPQPKSPPPPLYKGGEGEGEGDKDHRPEACATEG